MCATSRLMEGLQGSHLAMFIFKEVSSPFHDLGSRGCLSIDEKNACLLADFRPLENPELLSFL